MDLGTAKKQISDLLESSVCRSEWNDVVEEHFREAYWIEDIQIFPEAVNIWINWSVLTFSFRNVTISFELKLHSPDDDVPCEHGECVASGMGKFIYSGGNIVDIDELEINLSPQQYIQPQYDTSRNCCWNISAVINSLKQVYPYPNDAILAQWAGVTENTVKRWKEPKAHARFDVVEQLISSRPYNIAEVIL